jgi:hypothetical protein
VALMLHQALVPAVLGIVAGTIGALAISRLLAAFLVEVPATDPATFGAAMACSSARHSSPRSSRPFEASASIRPSPCATSSALASGLSHSIHF